jgi:hypothetical protein
MPPPTNPTEPKLQTAETGERELVNIKLCDDGRARILISGPTSTKEIDKPIKALHLQRELLADEPQTPDPPEPLESGPSEVPNGTAEEARAATPDNKAQISFFITKSQKIRLRERGYSDDAVAKMKPAEAHQILGLQ